MRANLPTSFPLLAPQVDVKADDPALVAAVAALAARHPGRSRLLLWGSFRQATVARCLAAAPGVPLFASMQRALVMLVGGLVHGWEAVLMGTGEEGRSAFKGYGGKRWEGRNGWGWGEHAEVQMGNVSFTPQTICQNAHRVPLLPQAAYKVGLLPRLHLYEAAVVVPWRVHMGRLRLWLPLPRLPALGLGRRLGGLWRRRRRGAEDEAPQPSGRPCPDRGGSGVDVSSDDPSRADEGCGAAARAQPVSCSRSTAGCCPPSPSHPGTPPRPPPWLAWRPLELRLAWYGLADAGWVAALNGRGVAVVLFGCLNTADRFEMCRWGLREGGAGARSKVQLPRKCRGAAVGHEIARPSRWKRTCVCPVPVVTMGLPCTSWLCATHMGVRDLRRYGCSLRLTAPTATPRRVGANAIATDAPARLAAFLGRGRGDKGEEEGEAGKGRGNGDGRHAGCGSCGCAGGESDGSCGGGCDGLGGVGQSYCCCGSKGSVREEVRPRGGEGLPRVADAVRRAAAGQGRGQAGARAAAGAAAGGCPC